MKQKRGFTYTHHLVLGDSLMAKHNRSIIRQLNDGGFTVNLSADTLDDADRLHTLNIGPVVCILPADAPKVSFTPNGHQVTICPAVYRDDIQCINCGICAVHNRKTIIGFPVHGSGKNKARKVFMMHKG